VDVHREEVFTALKSASVPMIYGPIDAFPYKVELKHASWRNTEKLLKPGAKFSIMSDHPVTLQRNIFYSLRLLDLAVGFISCLEWCDLFLLSSYPILVIAEGRKVYEEQ
jgi:hypothetical protein